MSFAEPNWLWAFVAFPLLLSTWIDVSVGDTNKSRKRRSKSSVVVLESSTSR